MSNPAQNGDRHRGIVGWSEIVSLDVNSAKVNRMEPYRPTLRRRLTSVWRFFGRSLGGLQALLKPRTEEVRLQRMCPFCGLITPVAKRVCLECGKPLAVIALERAEAK